MLARGPPPPSPPRKGEGDPTAAPAAQAHLLLNQDARDNSSDRCGDLDGTTGHADGALHSVRPAASPPSSSARAMSCSSVTLSPRWSLAVMGCRPAALYCRQSTRASAASVLVTVTAPAA